MFNVKHLFSHAVLAFSLAGSAGAALATPTTYHVAIDTTSVAGDALLNLTFDGAGNAGPATAKLSNFSGNYGAVYEALGAVSGNIATILSLSNTTTDNYLSQFVTLGGRFGFDVMFDVDNSAPGTQFSVALYLPEYAGYALGSESLATINLVPEGSALVNTGRFASVSEVSAAVPEPGQMLLMLTGLLLVAAAVRRRAH